MTSTSPHFSQKNLSAACVIHLTVGVLRSETVHLPQYFKGIREIEKQLDSTNVKILSAMWKFGPRNLLEVSRRTGIPFTSVYHRVAKLEAKSGRIAYVIPETSKLGMIRLLVLVAANAGSEEVLTAALKIPNLWRFINPCEGTFTHLSAQTVPAKFLNDFKKYIRQLSELGLIRQFRLLPMGDYIPNSLNFRFYDPNLKRWTFPWSGWAIRLRKITPKKKMEDPESYPLLADRKDLLIVKELEKDARRSFADLAPMLGITLQGVKHRYDKRLIPSGILRYFDLDVYPYPVEISACHEVMLDFTSNQAMNKFYSFMHELFFIRGVAKVLSRNALVARTYIPESQLPNMFTFFSEMAKAGMLESYSSVRLSFAGRETQTISYELFDNEKGWVFDLEHCLYELRRLAKGKRVLASGRENYRERNRGRTSYRS